MNIKKFVADAFPLRCNFMTYGILFPLMLDVRLLFTFWELLEHLSTQGREERTTNDCSKMPPLRLHRAELNSQN